MLNPFNLISKIIKSGNQKELDKIQKIVKSVNSQETEISKFSDEEFPQKTKELIDKLNKTKTIQKFYPEAFGLVREASKRVLKERHFDVQIIGGVVFIKIKLLK